MNKVILVGRLCHSPELKYVGDKNIPVTKFTLAVDRNYKNTQGVYSTDFINCELWRREAEVFCEYMTKGRLVYVEGRVTIDKYISATGENKKFTTIKCDSFKFIDYKRNDLASNTYNSNDIFTEEVFDGEISENEIPF